MQNSMMSSDDSNASLDLVERFISGGLIGWAFELLVYDKPKGVSYFRPIYAFGALLAQPGLKGLVFNSLIVAVLEGVAGVIYNQDYHLWDYRNEPFNWRGHFCLKSVLGLGLLMTIYASMPKSVKRLFAICMISMGVLRYLSDKEEDYVTI